MRLVLFVFAAALALPGGDLPKFMMGGSIQEVVWVRLDKDDLLLESLQQFIKERNFTDGAVLTAAGAVGPCKFHGVNNTMTEIDEPVELNHLSGVIADSQPHFHLVVSSKARGALGGHLEPGCRVSNQVELTLVRFGGPAMARKKSGPNGPAALQKK